MRQIDIWASLIPFVSIMFVMALIASGTIWRSVIAVVFVGCLSCWWAVVLAGYAAYYGLWLMCIANLLFLVFYLYVTGSLIRHLGTKTQVRDRDVVPDQSSHWSNPQSGED